MVVERSGVRLWEECEVVWRTCDTVVVGGV